MADARLSGLKSLVPMAVVLVVIGVFVLGARLLAQAPLAIPAKPETLHAYSSNVKVTVDPTTHWQPRGGEIKIILEDLATGGTASLADSLIAVHFRWQTMSGSAPWVQTPSLRTVEIANAKKLTIAVTVPEMPPSPSSPFVGLVQTQDGSRSFLSLVPMAEIWVTATNAKDPAFAIDNVFTMGVTSVLVALSAAGAAIVLILWFIWWNKPEGLNGSGLILQILETVPGHRASLSQFQIMLWTLLVGAATAYVMTISGNLVPLTSGTLVLLGISGVATLGSALKQGQDPAAAKKDARDPAQKPSWRDLIIDPENEIDVTRVQMLFFTILVAIYVAIHVIDNYEIPVVPESFLTLMGISNGVYLASKWT
jgi:hypothetical protein